MPEPPRISLLAKYEDIDGDLVHQPLNDVLRTATENLEHRWSIWLTRIATVIMAVYSPYVSFYYWNNPVHYVSAAAHLSYGVKEIVWSYKTETYYRKLYRERLVAVQDRISTCNRGYEFNTTPFPLIPARLHDEDIKRHMLVTGMPVAITAMIWSMFGTTFPWSTTYRLLIGVSSGLFFISQYLSFTFTNERYKSLRKLVETEHKIWHIERELQERKQAVKVGILPRSMTIKWTVGLKPMAEESWQMAAFNASRGFPVDEDGLE